VIAERFYRTESRFYSDSGKALQGQNQGSTQIAERFYRTESRFYSDSREVLQDRIKVLQ